MQLRALALAALCGCAAMPPACAAELVAQLVDEQGRPLANAVLSLKGAQVPDRAAPGIMDQRDKQFLPTVLAVRSGTAVKFPNSDNIRHHVYSFSPPKRFELRLYKGTPSEPVLFDKPGVVVLGCNIHDWMVGYVYVTDDPWFAVSDAQGRLVIDGLPAGAYQVSLWHPQLANMLPQAAGSLQVPAQGLTQRFPLAVSGAVAAPAAPQSDGFGEAFRKAAREVQP
jgi:plastocyanin